MDRFVTRKRGARFYVHDTIMGRPVSTESHGSREHADADAAYYNSYGQKTLQPRQFGAGKP